MRTCTHAGAVCILGALIAVGAGCAGPSKISRGFDERVNQLNVDNPTLAEIAWPVEVVGTVGTKVVDWCVVNPWFFWEDVFVGRGTPYYYKNPVVPELPPEEQVSGSSGDEARGGESSGELLSVSDPLDAPYYAPPAPAYEPAPAPVQYREPAAPVRAVAAIDVPPPIAMIVPPFSTNFRSCGIVLSAVTEPCMARNSCNCWPILGAYWAPSNAPTAFASSRV